MFAKIYKRQQTYVAGAHCGALGTLRRIDEANFCVAVEVQLGEEGGRVLEGVAYEDVCKVAAA